MARSTCRTAPSSRLPFTELAHEAFTGNGYVETVFRAAGEAHGNLDGPARNHGQPRRCCTAGQAHFPAVRQSPWVPGRTVSPSLAPKCCSISVNRTSNRAAASRRCARSALSFFVELVESRFPPLREISIAIPNAKTLGNRLNGSLSARFGIRARWCRRSDSNSRHPHYECGALGGGDVCVLPV